MPIDGHVACSPASVYRVLKSAGLLAGQSPVPTKKGTGFVQPLTPHEHWHVDVSYLNIAGTFYFLCSILDGCSRFIVHWEIREKMEETDVETIIQRAREVHPGVTPRIITDNGPQFIAKDFKEFIRIAGMTHVKTSPYYPQSNGKIERWHKTLKGECIRVKVPLSLDDARRIVADYVTHYNTVRLHSAIGYVTPKDKLDGKDDRHLRCPRPQTRRGPRTPRQTPRTAPTVTATSPSRSVNRLSLRGRPSTSPPSGPPSPSPPSCNCSAAPLHGRGAQQRGPCPLHGSTSGTSRCFSANLDMNAFHCFKCGRRGNALDLWADATRQTPYDAAVDLCHRLGITLPILATNAEQGRGTRGSGTTDKYNDHRPDDASGVPPISPTKRFFQFTLNHYRSSRRGTPAPSVSAVAATARP